MPALTAAGCSAASELKSAVLTPAETAAGSSAAAGPQRAGSMISGLSVPASRHVTSAHWPPRRAPWRAVALSLAGRLLAAGAGREGASLPEATSRHPRLYRSRHTCRRSYLMTQPSGTPSKALMHDLQLPW